MNLRTFAVLAILPATLVAQTAEQIVQKSEDHLKGVSSRGRFRMTIVTPEYSRTMEMKAWWVGNEKALIAIISPRREAGNKTLKVGNELWMYLRNTETTIKVPPSMMLQSWNGSDFTNDDLVRESNLNRDYTMSILGREKQDGQECWKIELRPRPAAPVVWGRLLHWVRMNDYLPARTQYYDEKGSLVRTLTYTNVRKFGARSIPAHWEMINNAKPDHRTSFDYLDVEFDVSIGNRTFSLQELERARID